MAWKEGPLPPDTYGWGGVVLKGEEGQGFRFADFCGSFVLLPHFALGERPTYVRADEIAFYDNSLELPPQPRGGPAVGVIASVDELRRALVAKIDAILEAPWIVSRWMTDDDRRLLRAQRAFWQNDSGPALAALMAQYEREGHRGEG